MEFKKIITFGESNKNGRIYLRHQISELPKTVMCTLGELDHSNPLITDDKTGGIVTISMNKNSIDAEVLPFSDDRGKTLLSLLDNGYKLVPAGFGNVNEKGEIEDYRLQYVFLTNNPA